ncbi:MAG: PIG-L family deacetylase [Actinomycetota bacterium]|jgi:LmbE family N-acetylglucosaminyl deacetylase|uniref:PIG-L deacetylase family protein n=1 Tax=uncultured Ilumatobacter sp. TaxID=879968 RepID=UPI00374F9F3A|nr:PIG-L family deacetylase [Actinomycetota bacterium]
MSTLVCFHAHPDDEAIATGGAMARAAAEGHRVVLVVATNGDYGEVPDDLADGETLVDRRRKETEASIEALGAHRVVFLGYKDSGMTGWDQNSDPESFLRADLGEAAERLVAVLREEDAAVVTTYDWHGNYGHPDHIKVHEVGNAAADLIAAKGGSIRLFEATMNRDRVVTMMQQAMESGATLLDDGELFDPAGPADDGNPFGMPEAELTLEVDVTGYVDRKRAAIACHRSQISDQSFFLEMPPEAFAAMFGTESYIERGVAPPMQRGWIFD